MTWRDEVPYLRMLQPEELLRAMGFDAGYRLASVEPTATPSLTRRRKIKTLGNGVCPPVMQAVVNGLRECGALPSGEAPSPGSRRAHKYDSM